MGPRVSGLIRVEPKIGSSQGETIRGLGIRNCWNFNTAGQRFSLEGSPWSVSDARIDPRKANVNIPNGSGSVASRIPYQASMEVA